MLIRWTNPFSELEKFERSLFSNFWTPQKECWAPATDVKEEENQITIDTELPGMDEKDIKISIEENILTIEGERKIDRSKCCRKERFCGSFSRIFTLPDSAEINKIEATFNKGILTIKIPLLPKKIPKKIEVKVTKSLS